MWTMLNKLEASKKRRAVNFQAVIGLALVNVDAPQTALCSGVENCTGTLFNV